MYLTNEYDPSPLQGEPIVIKNNFITDKTPDS